MDYIVFNQTELDKTDLGGCVCLCDNTYNIPKNANILYAAIGEVHASIDLTEEECAERGIKFLNFTPVFLDASEIKPTPQNACVPIKWSGISANNSSGSFFGGSYKGSYGSSYSNSYTSSYRLSSSYFTASYASSYFGSYSLLYLTSYKFGGSYRNSYNTSYNISGSYLTSYRSLYLQGGSYRLLSSYNLRTSYGSSFLTSYRTSSYKRGRSFKLKNKNITENIDYIPVNGYGINLI